MTNQNLPPPGELAKELRSIIQKNRDSLSDYEVNQLQIVIGLLDQLNNPIVLKNHSRRIKAVGEIILSFIKLFQTVAKVKDLIDK